MAGEGKFIDGLMVGDVVAKRNATVSGNVTLGGAITGEGGSLIGVKDLVTTATLTAADSGKLVTLGLAGGFTVTLPALQAGLNFRFVVKIAPTTAYIIVTPSSVNKIFGVIASADLNAANDTSLAQASDTITLAANKALIGDSIDLVCDGTYWYARGFTTPLDGIVGTQAS